MSAEEPKPAAFELEVRWYYPTPERCWVALLVIEGLFLLWLFFYLLGVLGAEVVLPALGIALGLVGFTFMCAAIVKIVRRRYRPVDSWRLLVAVVFIAVPCVGVAVFAQRHEQYRRTHDRVMNTIELLRTKRPTGISPGRWEHALDWTHNAVDNCVGLPDWIVEGPNGEDQFARFADELEERAAGRVGVETIDWMWDEIVRLAKYSDDYLKQYRLLLWSKEH